MSNESSGASVPETLVGVDLRDSAVWLKVDGNIYSLEALYGACFTFIDRCFVFIEAQDGGYRVVLSTKKKADEAALSALVGEFANELLSCAWREKIMDANRATIEAVTMQALSGALGAPSLDDLEDFDFGDEPFDDPLGIAMSWEEKYGKDKKARKEGEARPEQAPEGEAAAEETAPEGEAS